MHVLDALEEDVERVDHQVRPPRSSQFAQNSFSVLDTTDGRVATVAEPVFRRLRLVSQGARVSQASGRVGVVDESMQDASVPGSGTHPHEELSVDDTVPGLPQEVFAAGVVDRRRRRVRNEGSDPGPPIFYDLTLIDSSDDDTPFVVTRSAAAPRPSRRLVLVPESVNATPQSIQDRDWDRGASESSLIDRTLGSDRSFSVVPGSNSGVEVDEESVSSATSDTVSLFSGSEASGEEVPEPVPEVAVEVPVLRATGLQLRAAWQAMDAVDMSLMFQHQA